MVTLGREDEIQNGLLFFLRRLGFAGSVRLILFSGIMENLLLFQFFPVFIGFFLFLVVFPFREIIDFIDHQTHLGWLAVSGMAVIQDHFARFCRFMGVNS